MCHGSTRRKRNRSGTKLSCDRSSLSHARKAIATVEATSYSASSGKRLETMLTLQIGSREGEDTNRSNLDLFMIPLSICQCQGRWRWLMCAVRSQAAFASLDLPTGSPNPVSEWGQARCFPWAKTPDVDDTLNLKQQVLSLYYRQLSAVFVDERLSLAQQV